MNYAALYLYRGYANEHSGNPKKALADYSEAIHINPAYYDAYYLRSSLCFKMKKFNTVILDTTTAINLPSELKRQDTRFSGLSCVDDNVLRNLRADACFFSGDYRNAANDYTLLLGSRNYSAEALRKKAECLYHLGSFTEAVKIFTRVLERDPYSAEAYFLRGSIYLNDEQYELAENDFTKSISLLLNNTKAYIRRAYAESFNGRHTDALKDLETAKALEPDNPELLRTYGVVFLNMKMKVKAIDYFRRAANTGDTVSSNWLKRNK
jgi:tetratricopeptide (TPR) repeat protein